jgi:Flp pilus assembly protein CpaB
MPTAAARQPSSDADPTGGPTRALDRRRALPSGRAALGALLVTIAVLGTLLVQHRAGGAPSTRYVVATSPVAPGQRVQASDLHLEAIDLPASVARQSFARLESVEAGVALRALEPGELIEAGDIARAVDGESSDTPPAHEVTVALERDRALDGQLVPGERVDLVATYGTGESATTLVVVHQVRVSAVSSDDSAIGSAGAVTVTLAVTSADEALRVSHAAEVAGVRLVRATKVDPEAPEAPPYRGPVDDARADDGEQGTG